MQCFFSTLVGFPMSVTCWPRLCGSSPPSERPVAALWTPWSPTGVMSIAIPLGVTTPDTSYSDMAAGSEWVLPTDEEKGKWEGARGLTWSRAVGLVPAFSSWEKGAPSPLAVWEMGVNKCSVMEIGKFDRGYGEKENSTVWGTQPWILYQLDW